MPPGQESSGGSAANTCAVAAGLGARVAFLGKVPTTSSARCSATTSPRPACASPRRRCRRGAGTARCLILVTPDGQRTMTTYLGACVELRARTTSTSRLIARAQVTYLEGYLFDPPQAQDAFRARGRDGARGRAAGGAVLSDPFCVDRHRAAFRELVRGHVDILFANEAEICSLYETDDFAAAAAAVRGHVAVAALTRSARGSVILAGGAAHRCRRRRRSRASSTRPAPATSTPPVSSTA